VTQASPPTRQPEPVPGPILPPAPLARRFGALVVDWVLCVMISALCADPRRSGWPPLVALVAEYGFFLGLFGQTPGMWVTRLACLGYHGTGPIGVPRALLRGILLALVVPALIMDGERRGLHDRAVGSIVLDVRPPA
jgi:uncharacterized RDD family membrane protein YckC